MPWQRGGVHKQKLKDKMGDPKDGDQKRGGTFNEAALGAWFKDMETWGRRVRRDIILLEAHLQELNDASAAPIDISLYDDPGDPPPPPNGFY